MKTVKSIRKDAYVMEEEIKKMIKAFHEKYGEGCTLSIEVEYGYIEFAGEGKKSTGIDVKVNVEI